MRKQVAEVFNQCVMNRGARGSAITAFDVVRGSRVIRYNIIPIIMRALMLAPAYLSPRYYYSLTEFTLS